MRALLAAVCLASAVPAASDDWTRARAVPFVVLPQGATGPEGLEVDARGDVYVATFGYTSSGPAAGLGQLHVFDRQGRPLRQLSIADSSPHLLGLRFHPLTGALLVVDFGGARVLAVDPRSGASAPFLTLPALPHPGGAGLTDLTFDSDGNVYVSDSLQGVVWRAGADGGVAAVWADDPLLRTTGSSPFGANGLRFEPGERAIYVANSGAGTVVRIPVVGGRPGAGGTAGPAAVFVSGLHGADGLLVDDDGDLWVAASQSDEIVVVDPAGKAIARLGDFAGVADDGQPVELLFPASLRFSGHDLLVTNLALDLRLVGPEYAAVDSPWCASVTRYTVSRIKVRGRLADAVPSPVRPAVGSERRVRFAGGRR